MFAIIGMFVVGLWILRVIENIVIRVEQARQLRVINYILAYKGTECICCGQEKCMYS